MFASGDGIYEAVRRVLVPFRKMRIPGLGSRYLNLTQRQLRFNKKYGEVRS